MVGWGKRMALGFWVMVLFGACVPQEGNSSAVPSGATTITIKSSTFEPNPLTVPAGSLVSWKNEDLAEHDIASGTVVAPDSRFRKALIGTAAILNYKFENPGTYYYHCNTHPSMQGVVNVQ